MKPPMSVTVVRKTPLAIAGSIFKALRILGIIKPNTQAKIKFMVMDNKIINQR